MTNANGTLDALLKQCDPMGSTQPQPQDKAATLEAILCGESESPRIAQGSHRSRRIKWATMVTGVAAAGVLAFALLPGGFTDPQTAAAAQLLAASRSAASAEVIAPVGPQRLYTKTVETSITEYQAEGVPNNPAEWSESSLMFEKWIAADESYYDVRTPLGKPKFGPGAQRQQAQYEKDPQREFANWHEVNHYKGEGAQPDAAGAPTLAQPNPSPSLRPDFTDAGNLPTQVDALRDLLRRSHGGSSEDIQGLWTAAVELLADPHPSAQVRSVAYQVIAEISDVQLLGNRTDAAGRTGQAVVLDFSDGSREAIIFNTSNGGLLQHERGSQNPSFYTGHGPINRMTTYYPSVLVDKDGLRPEGSKVSLQYFGMVDSDDPANRWLASGPPPAK